MFCPKCGTKLPDNSKFCSACGEKIMLEATEEATPEQPRSNEPAETSAPVSPARQPKPKAAQPARKAGGKKLIGIAIAVVVVIVAIIGIRALIAGGSSNAAYAYLSDGKYNLITNLDKGKNIEIASSKSDAMAENLLAFSPDGTYIYYYTKYDPDTQTGSLCRAEWARLKENSTKNEKYIEIIATNVSLGFRFLKDGSVTYKNGDNTLYRFDGEETVQIAKEVAHYFSHEEGRLVYAIGNYYDGYTLYGVSLSDLDDRTKLASNFEMLYSAADLDNILYEKYEDDGSATLYTVGFSKAPEKLGERVENMYLVDGTLYFTAANGSWLSLYDYVDDSYATADAALSEPDREDYSVPEYSYSMIYGSDLSESDFDELYTTCNHPLYLYGESKWNSRSMEEALTRDWGDNTDALVAATQRFIDQYADTADDLGMIPVTDEVRAALMDIQQAADDPENEWQWLWLCYNRYQSGTSTDYDAYDAAYEAWYDASDRIDMREVLQDPENDHAVRTLYKFEDGKLTTVNESVVNATRYDGAVMFNTTDMLTETVSLADIDHISDVEDLLRIDPEDRNPILLSDGSICTMSVSATDTYMDACEASYGELHFTPKSVYLFDGDGALSVAPINKGVVESFTVVTDDVAFILDFDDTTLYYAANSYESGRLSYFDLYTLKNGTTTCIAQDVLLDDLKLYSDGTVLAYTGYRSSYGYELTMIDSKGERTLIGDNVTQYIRVDKSTLLFISDGDLYCYNGKDRSTVKTDVDWVWSQDSMEIEHTFTYDDYDYADAYYD